MQPLAHRFLIDLIQAAQEHEQSAFDQLYSHYADALHSYLYSRCGDPVLAEDLLGDLWVRVVERLPSFRLPASGAEVAFTGWLFQIARNLVIDQQRRKRRTDVPLTEGVRSGALAPELAAEQHEEAQALYSALAILTPDQREIVVLRFFQELTSAEIAARTQRTEGAVKALQHRALATLARALARYRSVEI
jgi:RNA polymerase sigma-70 factor (ECF subfamily)